MLLSEDTIFTLTGKQVQIHGKACHPSGLMNTTTSGLEAYHSHLFFSRRILARVCAGLRVSQIVADIV